MTAFEAPRALKGKDTGYTAFDLHPSTPVIGAEIRNLRLSNLSEKTAEQLRHALWRYGVLFLRDQFLSHDELSAAGRLFGPELENHTV
jgi:alpha-ketoglutarate-dependent taurine dioxygenase